VHIDEPERRVDLYPHELSGGMKQRVMIGGALACRPRVLVADEPTTALDVTVQARIIELLRRLRSEDGLSLILVSHDLGVVASLCDRVVVMRNGVVVEQGLTREVLSHPHSDYTRELIAAHPSIHARDLRSEVSSPGASRPILAVEHLSVRFGQRRGRIASALIGPGDAPFEAVRDVTFTVNEGEILGVVGESGSGKTTIGRTIVGLTPPTEGRISFRGEVLEPNGRSRSPALRRAIQLVFQDPYASLNPRMSVKQSIAEPLRRHRLVPAAAIGERVAELMGWVELASGLVDRRPHELSGGQRQRVAIARALAAEPQLLIADEVTSALDVTIQQQILSLLRRLSEELALNLVIISHDLGVVRVMCHRVVVMRHGSVVEAGSTHEVMSLPRADYTRELVAAVPRLPSSNGAAYA
jgi:peptide/nickel transport system ATP-binding protein